MTKPLKSDVSIDLLRATHRALFDRCIDYAETSLEDGENEEAARWLLIAATSADNFGCGQFVSARLEKTALRLAGRIPPERGSISTETSVGAPCRWLHVMSVAYPVGGHTAFVRRWIEADDSGDQHQLVLTQMTDFHLPALTAAVARRGGRVTLLGGYLKLTDKAWRLRRLANRNADRIVLHIHMWDVTPTLAFGVAGGPPVLLLNHADHTFWVGAAVADRVIEFRPAGADLTRRYRGVDRILELPIPLPASTEPAGRLALRASLREALSIPSTALVFLTIGHGSKYFPVGDLDFLTTALRLLTDLPEAYLVAVGPNPQQGLWEETAARAQQRIIAVGAQLDLVPYHAAADIYLESFPRGSITALLEAAQSGLPVVRLPACAPPPASAEYPPLTAISQPADVDGYLAMALRFAHSTEERCAAAAALGKAIDEFQGAAAWRAKLDALKRGVPAVHEVYPPLAIDGDLKLDRFWTTFRQLHGPHDPVSAILDQALHHDLIGALTR